MKTSRMFLVAVLLWGFPPNVARAEDPMLYVIDEDGVTFTNVPGHEGAKPVPGFPAAATTSATRKPVRPRGLALPSTAYDPTIERVARQNGLSPDLVKAVALVESGLDPQAISPAGAQGLMQLMPATAQQYGVTDVFNPLANLEAGARHLRSLLDEFDGDLELALAAYNAGSGAVRRHRGVPAYAETVNYVRKVQEKLGQPLAELPPASKPARPVQVQVLSDGSVLLSN